MCANIVPTHFTLERERSIGHIPFELNHFCPNFRPLMEYPKRNVNIVSEYHLVDEERLCPMRMSPNLAKKQFSHQITINTFSVDFMTLEWHLPQCITILEPVSWVLFALNVWIICRTHKIWPAALLLANLIFRDGWIIQLRHFNEGNPNELQNIESSYFFGQNSLLPLEFENRNISLKVWLERRKHLRPQDCRAAFYGRSSSRIDAVFMISAILVEVNRGSARWETNSEESRVLRLFADRIDLSVLA